MRVLVWDQLGAPPPGISDRRLLWRGYDATECDCSLLAYCETHADRLRSKYLDWIAEFQQSDIGGRPITEILDLEPNFSYWCMTPLAEKSHWKFPEISDAIRLMAADELLVEWRPTHVDAVTGRRPLHEALRALCRRRSIRYRWRRARRLEVERLSLRRRAYRMLPHSLQGIVVLLSYFRARWAISRKRHTAWIPNASIVFCSYLFNLGSPSEREGTFRSRYWGPLVGLMAQRGIRSGWIELYYAHRDVGSIEAADRLVSAFNRRADLNGSHLLLDARAELRLVPRILARWARLWYISWRWPKLRRRFQPRDAALDFWPLMKKSWHSALRGRIAVENLIWIELFDSALRGAPQMQRCFYLCENQSWERALAHAWRKHQTGALYGVPHATRSFWDLRFTRLPQQESQYPIPGPDYLVVNGPAAKSQFLTEGYGPGDLVEGEALRYGYLANMQPNSNRPSRSSRRRILILGDYLARSTRRMLDLLCAAVISGVLEVDFIVKPHPNCPIDPNDYPTLQLAISEDPLERLLPEMAAAYVSNITSAGVDAYLANLPVVVMLDDDELNFSPLRSCIDVCFVSTPAALRSALSDMLGAVRRTRSAANFFYLDDRLPRWQRLVGRTL